MDQMVQLSSIQDQKHKSPKMINNYYFHMILWSRGKDQVKGENIEANVIMLSSVKQNQIEAGAR